MMICFFADTTTLPCLMSRRPQSKSLSADWVQPRTRCVGLSQTLPKSSWIHRHTTSGMTGRYSIFLPHQSNGLRISGRSRGASSRAVTSLSARLARKALRNAAGSKSCVTMPSRCTASSARVFAWWRVLQSCTAHHLIRHSNFCIATAGSTKAQSALNPTNRERKRVLTRLLQASAAWPGWLR